MIKYFATVFLLAVALFAGVGCEELRNGDQPSDSMTVPRFFMGELRFTEVTPYDRAWRGVQVAMKELNYTIKSSEHDLIRSKIIANGADKDIKIEIEDTSPTTTEIRIRVGKMGDKPLEQHILDVIRKHM